MAKRSWEVPLLVSFHWEEIVVKLTINRNPLVDRKIYRRFLADKITFSGFSVDIRVFIKTEVLWEILEH